MNLRLYLKVGQDIQKYVDKLTNGNGLDWIRKNLGNAIFCLDPLATIDNTAYTIRNVISLPFNFEYDFWGYQAQDAMGMLAHELGHVWDNNSSSNGDADLTGGGWADGLFQAAGGTNLPTYRFTGNLVTNKLIPQKNQFQRGSYGNNSSADYFAQSFSDRVYANEGPDTVPQIAQLWVDALVSLTN